MPQQVITLCVKLIENYTQFFIISTHCIHTTACFHLRKLAVFIISGGTHTTHLPAGMII